MMTRAFRKYWPHRVINACRYPVRVRFYVKRVLASEFVVGPQDWVDLPSYFLGIAGVEHMPGVVIEPRRAQG